MISIVIPTYNSSNHIHETIEHLKLLIKNEPLIKEIIFVNDYSSDNTLSILKQVKKEHPLLIRIFDLNKNFGQHPATLIGILNSKYKYCLTMDDDVLFKSINFQELINKIDKNPNQLIYLIREIDNNKKIKFLLITSIFKIISNTKKVSPIGTSQRFFNTETLLKNSSDNLNYIYLDVLFLIWKYKTTFAISNYEKHPSNHYRYSVFKRLDLLLYSLIFYTHIKNKILLTSILLVISSCITLFINSFLIKLIPLLLLLFCIIFLYFIYALKKGSNTSIIEELKKSVTEIQ